MESQDAKARDVVVNALRDREGNISGRLDRLLEYGHYSGADRSLARELALGSHRRKRTLDVVMKTFLSQPGRKLPAPIKEILYVGLYQLLYLSRVPEFAAINEAVEQTKRFNHKRKAGMVNGILRTVERNISPLIQGVPKYASNILPVGPNEYRQFEKNVFIDPSAEPAEYLCDAFSLPMSLCRRWCERLGSFEKAARVATHANSRAPFILRVNSLKTDPDSLLQDFSSIGIEAQIHENGKSIVLAHHANISELPGFKEGFFQPQDPTATHVAIVCEPQPGMKVLDFCAAPGTKTTHLAELMQNKGSITAADVSQMKLEKIEHNCRRLGIDIVSTVLSEQIGQLEPESFDLALVDAPCSNSGVFARRAEARWRFESKPLGELVKDQQFLLSAAATFVASGGRLVYSTCSIEKEENQDITNWFVKNNPRFKLNTEKLTLPGGESELATWHDGGYYAIFEA